VFFASVRNWGEFEQIAGMYEAIDPRSFVFNPALGCRRQRRPRRPAIFEQRLIKPTAPASRGRRPRGTGSPSTSLTPRSTDRVFTSGTQAFDPRGPKTSILGIQTHVEVAITSKLLLEASVELTNSGHAG